MIPGLPPDAVAVIFHSVRAPQASGQGSASREDGYAEMAERMDALAAQQPGHLGIWSVRDEATGEGISVSYWRDDASARAWKAMAEHLEAQRRGREEWYAEYGVVVAEVIRAYHHP
jgi:heme-degrading monooxygenase HmoA